jgi:hypothetical protein
MKNAMLTLLVVALGTTSAPAQGWAEKMFKEGLAHNFGTVPRGAQLFHKFTITNIYAVRMEITQVKSGCGCVTATATKRVLEPRESTTIEVSMDARRFTGPKTVAVRVTVGPEFISSAELKVSAHSRADIVFNPGDVNFGVVTRGQTPMKTIDVEYAGTLAWQVSDAVVPKDAPITADFKEMYRRPGQVGYQVRVTLKAEAPAGTQKQIVYLKTNDPASPLVPVLVEAMVQSSITVSTPTLMLTGIKVGSAVMRKVVVRGTQPFRVVAVEGTDDGISLAGEPPATAALQQVLTFKCQPNQPGEFKRELKIKTDLDDAPVTVTIEGSATP